MVLEIRSAIAAWETVFFAIWLILSLERLEYGMQMISSQNLLSIALCPIGVLCFTRIFLKLLYRIDTNWRVFGLLVGYILGGITFYLLCPRMLRFDLRAMAECWLVFLAIFLTLRFTAYVLDTLGNRIATK